MLMTLKTARLWSVVATVILVAGAVSALESNHAAPQQTVWSASAAH